MARANRTHNGCFDTKRPEVLTSGHVLHPPLGLFCLASPDKEARRVAMLERLVQFFRVPDDAELVQSQARAFTRQIPLMYGILLINTVALAYTHNTAPPLLSLYVPSALGLLCIVRVATWARRRGRSISEHQARKLLKTLFWVAGLLGASFSSWALSLLPYGNAYQQSHVALYMSITSIWCVFCLTQMRAAALVVALCVAVPFATVFLTSGNSVYVAIAVNMLLVVGGLISILLGNYRDFAALAASRREMAERQQETQRLNDENFRLANVDALTQMPNRLSFNRELDARIAEGCELAVGRLDVDSFRSVNEIFGHAIGDRVLVEVAKRLSALVDETMFVARLGNDEFGVILCGPTSNDRLATWGDALCGAMRREFAVAGATLHVSVSAGLALLQPGEKREALFDRADYASMAAKQEARGGAVVFAEKHARDISKVRALEHALRTADFEREIYIVFQPQFDVSINRVTGYEVLARWRSAVLGEVSPAQFIPMAERIGVICKITQTVLRKSLAVVGQLPRPLRLSVNLSAHDICSYTAVEKIVAVVRASGTPCRIDFEVTETAVMRDLEQANRALLSLLSLGSRIALDDFGTGHSSLTHVQKLPLDRIKIDRSFVAEVESGPTSRAIIKTTIDLCRNLGISCVLEGIETQEQASALVTLGGTVMQGYFFGRPMEESLLLAQYAGERKVG